MRFRHHRDPELGGFDRSITFGSTRFFGVRGADSVFVSGAGRLNDKAAGAVVSAAGGTINGGYAVDSAFIAGINGGAVYNASAGSNASVDAFNQGYSYGATAGSSGAIAAASLIGPPVDGAGTAYNPHVLSGGYALAGGAPNLVVKGYRVQGSGGLISGGTFDSGSQTVVGNGGTAIGG
ncbi:hypothetical protein, partial [Saccharibacter floricola]|uniref:hypothetical protein n=1 Tax=Saccharibacter floricola TaxID=231053 RepID=UPI003570EE54